MSSKKVGGSVTESQAHTGTTTATTSPTAGDSEGRAGLFGSERAEIIDSGMSIRSRTGTVLSTVLLIVLLILALASYRAAVADEHARIFLASDRLAAATSEVALAAAQVEQQLWHVEAEPEMEHIKELRASLETLRKAVGTIPAPPNDFGRPSPEEIYQSLRYAESAIEPVLRMAVAHFESYPEQKTIPEQPEQKIQAERKQEEFFDAGQLRRAHLSLASLRKEATSVATKARELTSSYGSAAAVAMSRNGRDSAVFFVLFLLGMPVIFLGGVRWMIEPLSRLNGVAQRISENRIRNLAAVGNDEIAHVARALCGAIKRIDETDKFKTRKTFEIGRLVRSLVDTVYDPVLVIGSDRRVDYANKAMTQLIGKPTHEIERAPFEDLFFSPQFVELFEEARGGEIDEKIHHMTIEGVDGRVNSVEVRISNVRDSTGDVTRIVAVMRSIEV